MDTFVTFKKIKGEIACTHTRAHAHTQDPFFLVTGEVLLYSWPFC